MTLCNGQLNPIPFYRTGALGVRCSGVECHYVLVLLLDIVLFHHDFHYGSCD